MGNQISDGALTYTYNARGRLSGANGHSYVINGLGQRVSKSGSTITTGSTLFLYDEQGHLLGEYDATGQAVRETVYLGDAPVAVLSAGTTSIPPPTDTVWVEDAMPAGAVATTGNEGWTWITSNPAPYSGTKAHLSALLSGNHHHSFIGATATLPVNTGDTLYTYVYLDPANPPSEILLSWHDGTNFEHRAYWGANLIVLGSNGTNSRRYMGALPATGQWVKLAVPASQVGLEGKIVKGMAFTLYNGRATWDKAGKTSAGTTTSTTPATYYIHADHLNTPRALSDSTNKVIWSWASDPFGSTAANEDPDGDGIKFTYNLRFPGQYYDRETGLHYNYFRDYDPRIGRYVESDPVGLGGGINTYSYVGGNPISKTDPLGLWDPFGTNPQQPGCDVRIVEINRCTTKCCDEHDRCYERNGCNMLSWGVSGGILSHIFFACARCNHEAVICLAKAAIKCDDCKKDRT